MKVKKIHQYFALITLSLGVFGFTATPVVAISPTIDANKIHLPKITEENKEATQRVADRLQYSHYKKIHLDDAFSAKILNRYLNNIDYRHNLFLQQDIDQIKAQYADKFDDELKQGKLDIAFKIYDLMQQRRYERYKYALSLLDKEPNLDGQDQIEIDREKAPWPKNTAEANELWLQRVKNDIINQKLKDKKWPEIKEKLTKRYNLAIRRLTQTRSDDITQVYLNAFAREIDPHTSYLAPRTAKNFDESMNLSLEGIGATLQMEDDVTVIKSLIAGAPAALSKKIKVGDKIIGVGQTKNKIEDVVGWRLDDVVDKIKGKKGSTVYLEIEPESGGKSSIISLKRDKIRLEDQAAKLTVKKIDGHQIGVIEFPSFYNGLTKDVRKLLKDVKKDKVEALIIDLRSNGGGSLKEVIELGGLFITDGPVVQVRNSYNQIRIYEDPDNLEVYSGPLFVMINRYSASASEIFAAAMQDYQRAIILGQKTFGKGTVQSSRTMNYYPANEEKIKSLGAIQYTIQKFYRINGDSTQLKGVTEDIAFPAIIDSEENGEEKEDNALEWDRIPAAFYIPVRNPSNAIPELTEKHIARMAKEPEFIRLNKKLQRKAEKKDQKYLSLNYKQRKQEHVEDDQFNLDNYNARFKEEGKPLLKKIDDLPKDYEAPDFYLKEAEKIAVDYINFEKKENKIN